VEREFLDLAKIESIIEMSSREASREEKARRLRGWQGSCERRSGRLVQSGDGWGCPVVKEVISGT
jgi:hypothetical protein